MNRSRFCRIGILLGACWMGSLSVGPELWAQTPGANVSKIEAALSQISTAEFIEEPLEHAADYFSEFHDIGIQIDRRALEDIGLDEQEPITVSADGIRFESLLGLILEPHGLTWTVQHESLVITTLQEARNAVSTRIYLLDDLLKQAGSDRGHRRRYREAPSSNPEVPD